MRPGLTIDEDGDIAVGGLRTSRSSTHLLEEIRSRGGDAIVIPMQTKLGNFYWSETLPDSLLGVVSAEEFSASMQRLNNVHQHL